MDCHLNTSLQSRLLREIVNTWIPDDAQLWTASHALGFIDFARSAENASIIDLDLLNFDLPQVITPEPKENTGSVRSGCSKGNAAKYPARL